MRVRNQRSLGLCAAGLCAALGLALGLAQPAAAQKNGGMSGPRGGNPKTSGDIQQVLAQWQNGVVTQEQNGAAQMNGMLDMSRLNQHTVIWEDEEATTLSPPSTPPTPPPAANSAIAAAAAAASAAAIAAMNQINQADVDAVPNINVNNFVGEGADGGDDADAEDAAMQQLVTQATADVSNGQMDPDLAGDQDLSAATQSAALAAIYAGYDINAGGLTVTTLDYYPPYPSDVMTSLDLQPALCGR